MNERRSDAQAVVDNAPLTEGRRMELALSKLLIAGIIGSACLISLATVWVIARHGGSPVDYSKFVEPDGSNNSLGEVLSAALGMNARALLMAGVLVVLATPVARVLFSLIAFARERDMLYVTITGIVLAILVYSLFFGRL